MKSEFANWSFARVRASFGIRVSSFVIHSEFGPKPEIGLTTESTEDTERVKPGPGPVPSVLSVSSVVQYRIQGRGAALDHGSARAMLFGVGNESEP